MRKVALALSMVALSCASDRTVMAPDGKPAMYVKCGRDEVKCLDVAASACPTGYDVLADDRGGVSAVKVSESSGGYKAKVKPASRPFIMIRCH
jgi:hypothetical protein